MREDGLEAWEKRRSEIAEQIRAILRLPDWSNLRGDDVIALVEGLDADSRILANDLFVRMREMDDQRRCA